MIRWTYLIFYYLLVLLIAGFAAVIIIAAHPKTLPYLADKFLDENNITYSKIEGSLLSGITAYDINYADAVLAKRLEIKYKFVLLFKPQPSLTKIEMDQLRVIIKNLPASDDNSSGTFIPAFAVSHLRLNDTELILEKETLTFDLNVKKIAYRQDLDIKKLEMRADWSYGKTTLNADKFRVNIDDFLSSGKNASEFPIPAFSLANLQLKDTELNLENETLGFDINASKIDYRDDLDVAKLEMRADSAYGQARIKGNVNSNRLQGRSYIGIDPSFSQHYLEIVQGLPETFIIDLDADVQGLKMQTHFDALSLRHDPNLHLDNTDIKVNYSRKDNNFTLDSAYTLSYDQFMAETEHKLLFDLSGAYSSTLKATLNKDPYGLPFKTVTAQVQGDLENLKGQISAGQLEFKVQSQGYQTFHVHSESKGLALSFIPDLPDILRNNVLKIRSDAVLETSPFSLKGDFATEGLNCTINGEFELDTQDQLYQATLYPKPEAEVWRQYPLQGFAPFKFVYYNKDGAGILNLDAKILNLTLFKKETELIGWGNLGSSYFDTQGQIVDANDTRLSVNADIPSVHTLMSEFGFSTPDDELLLDAQADINATMILTDTVTVKSRVHLPWYIIKPDTQTSYQGNDVYLESTLVDDKITIDRYDLSVKEHHIYSQRPSHISFDVNGSLLLKEFWVYDNLLLSGRLNPGQMEGDLRLQSKRFNYESKEGNVTLKADIKAELQSDGRQNIEGEITLLEGVITYEPKTDYTISDDVIIIQDIKPRSKFKRFVNIHVNSLKPISYKTQDVDIHFTPDVILWQEPNTPLGIYGMVTIEDGQVTGGGKLFEFDKSEIYFNGSDPINPHLNLNVRHQTLDYIDIQIYITNTLSSPVVILASNPAMSQNDIMSYLLFGEPASSAFSSSGEGTTTFAVSSLLLATGLKQIFNDSAGVNIDTLNILTNEEGTLGYEIGTRFSKDIRVLYKNDTVSSVILQYSLSRSIRLDIDVHETGQGVSILYVKDF